MVVAAGEPIPMESFQRSPKATPTTSGPDRPSLHCCERSSPVKNRMPEIGASGTVRGGDGNILTYSECEPVAAWADFVTSDPDLWSGSELQKIF